MMPRRPLNQASRSTSEPREMERGRCLVPREKESLAWLNTATMQGVLPDCICLVGALLGLSHRAVIVVQLLHKVRHFSPTA